MRVTVVSAHPDDETLGCGGTLLRHFEAGDEINWIVMTRVWEPKWPREEEKVRAAQVDRVAAAYGMASVARLNYQTTCLSEVPEREIIDSLRAAIGETRPEVIYTVHPGDAHSDHRLTFSAAAAILKPAYMAKTGIRRVLCFETLSSTEAAALCQTPFQPNVFNDITGLLERKQKIMQFYEGETQEDPDPRGPGAIDALARLRGAAIGVEHAEAFVLVREIMNSGIAPRE